MSQPLDNTECLPLIAIPSEKEFLGLFPSLSLPINQAILLPSKKAYVSVLGVGLLDFSVSLSKLLAEQKYSMVFQIGISGAFLNRGISIGDVVRVESEIIGDLGAEYSDTTFLPWSEISKKNPKIYRTLSLEKSPDWLNHLRSVAGVSVNCCSGTENSALKRQALFNADVESMEGAACFAVCNSFGIPCYEIRAISNYVTTRQTSLWEIPKALSALKGLLTEAGFLCD